MDRPLGTLILEIILEESQSTVLVLYGTVQVRVLYLYLKLLRYYCTVQYLLYIKRAVFTYNIRYDFAWYDEIWYDEAGPTVPYRSVLCFPCVILTYRLLQTSGLFGVLEFGRAEKRTSP